MEEERRMNERVALEEEMRLKKERSLVEEQIRHVQDERKTIMKAEQKCLQEASAENEMVEEKEETSVDVMDKGGIEKLAWKLPDFIKRIGIIKVRLSLREREDQKRTKVKMKKRVIPKLRKSEVEFQKSCLKRRAKPKLTIRGDKATPRAYWDRGKKSSRDIIVMYNN
ncbi:hypothetical protein TNIN_106241 [Trichonephila inaurata madagascariensis]|uniref:DUF382 domain-containing protein n=1 Tax=Trichonephila inaurata madagascariensis TaxID=2747483 RepID=A0A8X7BXK1_9ARAC|nr:hypothetical protein TNIN_106241 [Trichonephila inaurata madagascariensis]